MRSSGLDTSPRYDPGVPRPYSIADGCAKREHRDVATSFGPWSFSRRPQTNAPNRQPEHELQSHRNAMERVLAERPGRGRAYLFPSPRNPAQPVSRDLASAWLERAEQLAKVGKQQGSLWHAYRRKWATERKHLPDVDVMAAGGWKDLSSLKTAYQHADAATLYRVVSEPAELREAKA